MSNKIRSDLISQKNKVLKIFSKYLLTNKIDAVVIGVSGGIDSAVSLCMLNEILPKNKIHAFFIDIESSLNDHKDAKFLTSSLGIKLHSLNLSKNFQTLALTMKQKNPHALGNIKSRLRALTLYDRAFVHNAIVIGNSNLDELYLGYFTKYGDNAVDICLLDGFIKSDIFSLAKYYNVPENILNKAPSAGLTKDQTDEKDLNLSYKEIDKFLSYQPVSKITSDKITKLHLKNKHKLSYNYTMSNTGKYRSPFYDKKNR